MFSFVACGPTPLNQETQRVVRKHVMKRIGKVRRGEKYKKKPKRILLQITEPLSEFGNSGVDADNPGTGLQLHRSKISHEEPRLVMQCGHSDVMNNDHSLPFAVTSPIDQMIGTGSSDPFIKYPFALDRASRGRLEYGTFEQNFGYYSVLTVITSFPRTRY
jgi:hypothetical protein